MRIALVNENSMIVEAVLVGNLNQQYKCPAGYTAITYPEDTTVGPKWTFTGTEFLPPPNKQFDPEPISEEN